MTEALFVKDKEGRITAFSIKGHSGYSDEGSDIVCASISSAAWMTVNGLENVARTKPHYTQENALISCEIPDDGDAISSSQVLLESLRQFLCNLSNEYEDYLTVKEVEK